MTVAANAPNMPMPPRAAQALRLMSCAPPPVPAYAGPVGHFDRLDFCEPDGKQRDALIQNIVDAMGPLSGVVIVEDAFLDAIVIGDAKTGHTNVSAEPRGSFIYSKCK